MQNWVCANSAPAAILAASLSGRQPAGGSIGTSAAPRKNGARPATLRPDASSPLSRRSRAIAVSVVESTSNTALVCGWSPAAGSSPVRHNRLRTPQAAAPMRSACSAIRLRSRQVNWRIGSMPARASRAAAIGAQRCARALAPSVTLTASARPASGNALRSRSSASHETGGVISAVTTNRPARSSSSRREAGCRCGEVIVLSGGAGREGCGARQGARVGEAAYISNRRDASKGSAHGRGGQTPSRAENRCKQAARCGRAAALSGQGVEAPLKAPAHCATPGAERDSRQGRAQHARRLADIRE